MSHTPLSILIQVTQIRPVIRLDRSVVAYTLNVEPLYVPMDGVQDNGPCIGHCGSVAVQVSIDDGKSIKAGDFLRLTLTPASMDEVAPVLRQIQKSAEEYRATMRMPHGLMTPAA